MSPATTVRAVFACLILTVCLGSSFADEAVRTEVLADDGDVIVLRFSVDDYTSTTVNIHGEPYQELSIPSEPAFLDKGSPALPHVNRSVIIPDNARMDLQVLSASFTEITADVAPSKGNLTRDIDPDGVPYEFGDVYDTDALYPGTLAQLHRPYIMRDHRGVVVQVNPFQYNPVTGSLRVYNEITVELRVAGTGNTNVFDRSGYDRAASRTFEDIYRSHFLNYGGQYRYDPINELGDMLIIAHDAWIPNVTPLATHKNSIGIPTTVVGVSTIGNNDTAIKSYIQSVYDTSDLAFVLLVGDIAEVDSPISWDGASDPSYSKLAGNDDYPEIIVGRFSAGTAAHVDTQVERTIHYETLPATQQDWYKKGFGVASNEGAGIGDEGQADNVHMGEIRDWLMGAGYTEVDEIYAPGATSAQVTAALNAGRGVANYCGHGAPTSWSTTGFNNTAVNSLTNDYMLPFIVSVACNNGEFENYTTCFAEAWLRATNNGAPTGAVGFYGSTILQSWAPPMEGQDEFNLLLTNPDEPYHSYGALCFAGSASMMDAYGSAGVEMFDTWIIFGDPSLRVLGTVDPPQGLTVTPHSDLIAEGLAGGPFGPATLQYTLRNHEAAPLDYEVTTSKSWVTLTNPMGTIPVGGNVTVTVTINDGARNLDNGFHTDDLQFVNLTTHDGDTSRAASVRVGLPAKIYDWTMDDNPNWSYQAKWGYAQPTGGGGTVVGNPDPDSGATGTHVYGVNPWGDYAPFVGGPFYLTSNPVDLSNATHVTLRFQRWLNTEAMPYSSASVGVSGNGVDWDQIWTNDTEIMDDSWSLKEYDLSAFADGRSEVSLRWGYGVHAEGANPCSGWNIDDIEIWSIPATAKIDLTVERADMSWTSLSTAVHYDVVRGDLGTLRTTGGDFTAATDLCLDGNAGGTTLPYTDVPADGAGHWYLVRGVSGSGPMTFQALVESQVGARDDEINAAGASCP